MEEVYKEIDLPEPLPLFNRGTYADSPKPEWKLKNSPRAVMNHSRTLNQVQFVNEICLPESSAMLYSSSQPKTVEQVKEWFSSILEKQSKSTDLGSFTRRNLDGYLKFNSSFESGNLWKAFYKSHSEYDLYIRVDSNTKGHCQWFYFSVTDTKRGDTVKFNIHNFTKASCLVPQGFKPVYKSTLENSDLENGWARVSGEVTYNRNYLSPISLHSCHVSGDGEDINEHKKVRKNCYYTLSFTHTFSHDSDTVYFAYSIPYTYTQLERYLVKIEEDIGASKGVPVKLSSGKLIYRREELCQTTGGLSVYIITITAQKNQGVPFKNRKGAVITSRIHPGEALASYKLEGFLSFILGSSKEAETLRSMYIFKVIPMLNPDGVMFGNNRTCLFGYDLNRQWRDPVIFQHPSIYHTKRFIAQFQEEREITIYCDFHGHARKTSSFIYGCNLAANEGFTSWTKVRLLPRVLASCTPMFDYSSCRFKVQQSKIGTGRVVVWKEFGITNSFTLETSFHGYTYGDEIKPFSIKDYCTIGEKLLMALLQYTFYLQQIEQELVLNHGWLKPFKMKELAGAPALDKQQKELEQKKKEERLYEIKEKVKKIAMKHARRDSFKGTNTLKLPPIPSDAPDNINSEKCEWRDFFTEEEMDEAYQSISLMKLLPESEHVSENSDSNSSSGDSYRVDSLPPITHTRRLSYKGERVTSEKRNKKRKKKKPLNSSSLKPTKLNSTSLERNESFTPNQFSISPMKVNNLSSEKVHLSPYHKARLSDIDSSNPHASSFDESHPIAEPSLKYSNFRPSSRNTQKLTTSLQTMKLIPTRSSNMHKSRLLDNRKMMKPALHSAKNKHVRLEELLSITNSHPETRSGNTSRPESELDHMGSRKISLYNNLTKHPNFKQKIPSKHDPSQKRNFIIQSVKVQLLPLAAKKPNASCGKMVLSKP